MKKGKKTAAILLMAALMTGMAFGTAYAWEQKVYTEEEVERALDQTSSLVSLEEVMGRSMEKQQVAFINDARTYVSQQEYPAIDPYNIDTYKAYYKQAVDRALDFLEWRDFSEYDNYGSEYMEVANAHKANPRIFRDAISHQTGKRLKITNRVGQYPDGKNYEYLYVWPYTEDRNSPFNPYGRDIGNGRTMIGDVYPEYDSMIERKGWFSDIYRYAQTRDEKYLFSEEFFPDIIDGSQRDSDGSILTYEEFLNRLKEAKKAGEERMNTYQNQYEARQEGGYITVRIHWIGEGYREKQTDYEWYQDDSLNDDFRNYFVTNMYKDGEYEKFLEEVKTVPWGGTIEFQENKEWIEGEPLLRRTLTRIK